MKKFNFLLIIGLTVLNDIGYAEKRVQVRFEVGMPRHLEHQSRVFISGSHASLGNWKPEGLSLNPEGSWWIGKTELPADTLIEFKVNLGDWEHGEVGDTGKEIENRSFRCSVDCIVRVTPHNFRLRPFHKVPSTASSSIHYFHEFYSESFGNYRSLAVYLPPQYFAETSMSFPVVYALDGNNLFDRATSGFGEEWQIDETLDRAFSSGALQPFIVVGIYNTIRRADEYLYSRDEIKHIGGKADDYMKFLLQKVKPFVDENFRTLSDRENTALLGSSFGGHFTLFAMKQYGHVFSKFASMSTAYWFKQHCVYDLLKTELSFIPTKLWLDMGDREGWGDGAHNFKNGVEEMEYAAALLKQKGLIPGKQIETYVHSGGLHNEISWSQRVELVFRFLFGR